MGNKAKWLIGGLIAVLIVVCILGVKNMRDRYDVTVDIDEVRSEAEGLYENGELEKAIERLNVYCKYVSVDIEARTTLGDWYMEAGMEEEALECYYNAAKNKEAKSGIIPDLTVKNKEEIILEPISDVVIEITPDVRVIKDMTLTITNHNLAPNERYEGKINGLTMDLFTDEEGYMTTEWFAVDPSGQYITMSGGFNTAIWQFRNVNGEITHWALSPNRYRIKNTDDVNVYQMARANIPEDAAWCRVTYFDKKKESMTASIDERLTIVYGRLPGESGDNEYIQYEIPEIKEGEKVVFDDGMWRVIRGEDEEVLSSWPAPDIERGSYVSIGGKLPGRVSFSKSSFTEFKDDGIYTIAFDLDNPSAMGRREDDAKNLGFNASVAQGWIALGDNDFDNIYPWSEMKLCNVKNGTVTAYEGDEKFSLSGSNGDVFVEIPKFYINRVIEDDTERISISGYCHEGFYLDPAFVIDYGEVDKIYIAAYMTSINDKGDAVSAINTTPNVTMSAKEIVDKAEKKGYREIDYTALSAIQRLFMVETGLRNSQYLYLGYCAYTDIDNHPYAKVSNNKTNCIIVENSYYFENGNSVIIFEEGSDKKTERNVTTVIDNGDGTLWVYFDGDPMNITADKTAIMHTVGQNGTTRGVKGHSGAMSTARGTVAFKYRGIENLWGNANVLIDRVIVRDNKAVFTLRDGSIQTVGYRMPETGTDVTQNMIKSIGYDVKMPWVMLPNAVGDGATTSTYYGDAYMGADGGGEYVLTYGGSWSSKGAAGLFSYDATNTAEDSGIAGRMMILK